MSIKSQVFPPLRFSQFENSWEETALNEVATFSSSKRVYLSDYVDQGVPFYRGKEISELKKNETPEGVLYISEESYLQYKEKYGVPEIGDILITAVGTLGNVLRITHSDPFYFKDGNLIWLRKPTQDPCFLELLLECKNEEILRSSIGSSQRALTMVELKKLKFRFPTLEEQRKIADFLTAVDGRIGQLIEKKALLEQYKKGVMQQLFAQTLRFKDDHGNPFPDWEEKRLGEVGVVVGGGTPDSTNETYWSGDVIWFTPSEIRSKYAGYSKRTITQEGLKKSSATMLPVGTLLLTSRATIAEISIATKPCTTNQGFQAIIVNSGTSNEFLYYWIIHFKKEFLRRAQGSTFLEIGGKEVRKIPLMLPSVAEQTKIADFLSSLDRKIEQVAGQIAETQLFKRGLLQQMFV
jgi:type I restriction enzyme S subunit